MQDHHGRAASVLRRLACVTVGVAALLAARPGPGQAQSSTDTFANAALAIASYEASKNECRYSAKLGPALAAIDAFLTRQDAYRWRENKRLAPDALIAPLNIARLGDTPECRVYGSLVGYAAIAYFRATAVDQEVLAEFNQLLEGGGRSLSGEAEARPPRPPAPGTAPAIIAEYNRQHPDMNRSADTGGQASTLRRLPASVPPRAASPSQPPPRQSALPPILDLRPAPAQEDTAPARPTAPTGRTQAPSAAAPTPTASLPPPAASAPVSSGIGAASCRTAGDCRLAEPTFACNLTDALALANLGAVQGGPTGLAAVRAGKCEIVPAGRALHLEATTEPRVLYATEQGRHVGYLPVGVFAPADQAATAACRAPGYCAVRSGSPAWMCPRVDALALPAAEAKRAAGCLQISSNVAAEVGAAEGETVALLNMVGGGPPPVPTRYYAVRADLVGLSLSPNPTPSGRGWCRPGDWCVTTVVAIFCTEPAAYTRIMALAGDARRDAILSSPTCRLLIAGNLLQPKDLPAAGDPRKLIPVEHPVLKAGWASANAFPEVAFYPPIRYTPRLFDLVISPARGASLVAVVLSAQGTQSAAATFRAGPKGRLAYCKESEGEANTESFRACLSEPDATVTVRADCEAKRVTVGGQRYELAERPQDAPADINLDERRQWLFRDLASGEWLDGSTASGEVVVSMTFDALCPGVNPEGVTRLAYRDPRARYPRELHGRYFSDRRACADADRNEPNYDEHLFTSITADVRLSSRGGHERINAVRPTGRGTWAIDEGGKSHEETETLSTGIYRLTREGFALTMFGRTSQWVRCP